MLQFKQWGEKRGKILLSPPFVIFRSSMDRTTSRGEGNFWVPQFRCSSHHQSTSQTHLEITFNLGTSQSSWHIKLTITPAWSKCPFQRQSSRLVPQRCQSSGVNSPVFSMASRGPPGSGQVLPKALGSVLRDRQTGLPCWILFSQRVYVGRERRSFQEVAGHYILGPWKWAPSLTGQRHL